MRKENFCTGWTVRPLPDEQWAPVRLPHDAMIHELRQQQNPSGAGGGYFPGGVYVYEKRFLVPPQAGAEAWVLEIEGAMRDAEVRLNDTLLVENHSGYRGFFVPLESALRPGEENRLQITVRNDEQPNSRWYSGAGLYRPVWLHTGGQTHIPPQGLRIDTPQVEQAVSAIRLQVKIRHRDGQDETLTMQVVIQDRQGQTVYKSLCPVTLFAEEDADVTRRIYLRDAALWSPEDPQLYTCHVTLLRGDTPVDSTQSTFGIRHLQLDPLHGLRLNGKPLLLRGGCVHHDNGILGAATFADAEWRRVALCKEAGFNALRMAHHPMSKAMLEACDALGMLVWEETFDTWLHSKTAHDDSARFEAEWEQDLQAMVAKDYNHPSVAFYCIGNEIEELAQPEGVRVSRRLANALHKLDDTRFATNAVNGQQSVVRANGLAMLKEMAIITKEHIKVLTGSEEADDVQIAQAYMAHLTSGNVNDIMTALSGELGRVIEHPSVGEKLEEIMSHLDLCGYNYMMRRYAMDLAQYPDRVIAGAETNPPQIDRLWAQVTALPGCIGDFTWSAWDYIGEAGVGITNYEGKKQFHADWPAYLAYCGDFDLIGTRRPLSYLRQIVFGLRKQPYLSTEDPCRFDAPAVCTPWAVPETVESWTWPGWEGKPVRVQVYADGEEAALLLNGREIGRAPVGANARYTAEFITQYEPGELTVVAYEQGKETGRMTLRTAMEVHALAAQASCAELDADGQRLCFVSLAAVDEQGEVYTASDAQVEICLEDGLELAGFGSADPYSTEPLDAASHRLFHGRGLAALRGAKPGHWKCTLRTVNCKPTVISLNVTEE